MFRVRSKDNTEKRYGWFQCTNCNRRWESANAWVYKGTDEPAFGQECRKCKGAPVKPYKVEELICSRCGLTRSDCDCDPEEKHNDPNKPHRSDLCEKCKSGRRCRGAIHWRSQGEADSEDSDSEDSDSEDSDSEDSEEVDSDSEEVDSDSEEVDSDSEEEENVEEDYEEDSEEEEEEEEEEEVDSDSEEEENVEEDYEEDSEEEEEEDSEDSEEEW